MNYYIYHIPSRRKIGCTEDLHKRMKKHKVCKDQYEILETHTCPQTAGDRELELQEQYGYPKDKHHYLHIRSIGFLGGKIGGAKTIKRDDFFQIASAGGKSRRSLTFDIAEEIRERYEKENISHSSLAKEYNVSAKTISRIILKQRYANP